MIGFAEQSDSSIVLHVPIHTFTQLYSKYLGGKKVHMNSALTEKADQCITGVTKSRNARMPEIESWNTKTQNKAPYR